MERSFGVPVPARKATICMRQCMHPHLSAIGPLERLKCHASRCRRVPSWQLMIPWVRLIESLDEFGTAGSGDFFMMFLWKVHSRHTFFQDFLCCTSSASSFWRPAVKALLNRSYLFYFQPTTRDGTEANVGS